jgi:hypothetical protein
MTLLPTLQGDAVAYWPQAGAGFATCARHIPFEPLIDDQGHPKTLVCCLELMCQSLSIELPRARANCQAAHRRAIGIGEGSS